MPNPALRSGSGEERGGEGRGEKEWALLFGGAMLPLGAAYMLFFQLQLYCRALLV